MSMVLGILCPSNTASIFYQCHGSPALRTLRNCSIYIAGLHEFSNFIREVHCYQFYLLPFGLKISGKSQSHPTFVAHSTEISGCSVRSRSVKFCCFFSSRFSRTGHIIIRNSVFFQNIYNTVVSVPLQSQ